MLKQGLGYLSGLALTASIASFVGALQGSDTPAGKDGLWISTVVFLAIGLVAGAGWFLARSDEPGEPTTGMRLDRQSHGFQAGRDLNIEAYHETPAAPAPKVPPNVVVDGFAPSRGQRLQWSRPTIDLPTQADFVRVRFTNEPAAYDSDADIPNLHAVIEFYDEEGNLTLTVPDGRWADNPDRGSAPSRETKSVDLPATGETRILDIAMRPAGWNIVHGWDHNGSMILDPILPTGSYEVRVILSGTRMTAMREFRFVLDNPIANDPIVGYIEGSEISLREADDFENPASVRRVRERAQETRLKSLAEEGD